MRSACKDVHNEGNTAVMVGLSSMIWSSLYQIEATIIVTCEAYVRAA